MYAFVRVRVVLFFHAPVAELCGKPLSLDAPFLSVGNIMNKYLLLSGNHHQIYRFGPLIRCI